MGRQVGYWVVATCYVRGTWWVIVDCGSKKDSGVLYIFSLVDLYYRVEAELARYV